jgi:hypothetical protein
MTRSARIERRQLEAELGTQPLPAVLDFGQFETAIVDYDAL